MDFFIDFVKPLCSVKTGKGPGWGAVFRLYLPPVVVVMWPLLIYKADWEPSYAATGVAGELNPGIPEFILFIDVALPFGNVAKFWIPEIPGPETKKPKASS